MKKINKMVVANNRGFSLIEIMAVIVILGFIASIAAPKYFGHIRKAKQQAAKTQIEMLMTTMSAYRLDVGDYPSQSEGLDALITDPGIDGWDGPYLDKSMPLDPWKREYQYANPGQHGEIDIYSLGKDNREGGTKEDKDIGSWQ